jgi:hypothetical protein
MTKRRDKRNVKIRYMFDRLRAEGLSVGDALNRISEDIDIALEPGTVRKIVYDKNYCKRRRCVKKLNNFNSAK